MKQKEIEAGKTYVNASGNRRRRVIGWSGNMVRFCDVTKTENAGPEKLLSANSFASWAREEAEAEEVEAEEA